ncbi:MAG: hypothetical protein ISS72_00825 [Candidatus Brocadiae bacterium]|nr:hypothetical protein [Candidatus Brocadiia bacterium]
MRDLFRRLLLGSLALALAAAVWLPTLSLLFHRDPVPYLGTGEAAPRARAMALRHVRMWTDPALREREIAAMRRSNAEWDFMGRTFLVLGLAEMALRDPDAQDDHLAVIDAILDETLRLERKHGHVHFLMPYARGRPFVVRPTRSLFVDGEIALMLAARRLVAEKPPYKPLLGERVRIMVERMQRSPVLCAESYPDECWTFCNAVALAAIRLADVLDGSDHAPFLTQWVATAKAKLVHQETGLLVSSFTQRGATMDGPEGTSLWLVAHCLTLIDPDFAADQYARARRELGRHVLGFGYSREWPRSWRGPMDIDSGPVVPVLEASASASGLAMVAARSFGDTEYFGALLASLEFAGLPIERDGARRYAASNAVGDAVVLYAMVLGPLWEKAWEGRAP